MESFRVQTKTTRRRGTSLAVGLGKHQFVLRRDSILNLDQRKVFEEMEQGIVSGIKVGQATFLTSISLSWPRLGELRLDGFLEPVDQEISKIILD